MGTTRQFPQSITSRQKALNKAVLKNSNLPTGVVILSPATLARLIICNDNYNAGVADKLAAKQLYHAAVEAAIPQRKLLRSNITSFFKTFNNCIDNLGTIPASARAFYGLPIGKAYLPKMDTDDKLLAMAALVITGDVNRRAAGGIAMNSPTIAQYTIVYNIASPIILAIAIAESAVSLAVDKLEKLIPETKDLITHVWDEVEAYYSLSTPSNRRTQCRLWGVRYISTGVLSLVTGTCKDILGVGIAGVKVRIMGSGHFVLSDALGNFSLNTSLYGDLELLASHIHYINDTIEFTKEDGIETTVAVVLEHVV